MTFTLVDMFAGAGLYSAGFKKAGFEPILAVDLDREAMASYRRNVSPCGVAGSVTDFKKLPRADVLIAGPPCQGFSTLGRQDPLDLRNQLSMHVPEWARRIKPKIVVIENVPPFLRSVHWRRVRDALVALGYEVDTWELDAADFGTPQRRHRAFTIASKIGPVERPKSSRARRTAGAAISTPIAADDPMHSWPIHVGVSAERIALVPPGGDKRDITRRAPHICPPSWFKVGCQATDVWGRMLPDEPANTIRCTFQNPSKGRYLHPTENRVLSLREGARLQGVPDNWIFSGRPYPVARQIGNGVPIPLAYAVGKVVRAALT